MNPDHIKKLLENISAKKISVEEALHKLKVLPFEQTESAHIDHHRNLRTGFPEVIFGETKKINDIIDISKKIIDKKENVLITRINSKKAEKIKEKLDAGIQKYFQYEKKAKAVSIALETPKKLPGKITVVTAGTADIPVASEAAFTAKCFGAEVNTIFDVGVAGIHRLMHYAKDLAESQVVIAVAGMEGALPSVAAGISDTPVIAVPTSVGYGANLNGFSALLTMLNSCSSIAVMNIDNGFGAARFACGILNKIKLP